jgi:hypothetical protein
MLTRSLLAKAAIVAVTAFAAHGLVVAQSPDRAPDVRARIAPLSAESESRLVVEADTGAEVTVRAGDVDPTSARGARVMLRRIESAADKVCADAAPCERQAVSTAVARLAGPYRAPIETSDANTSATTGE